MMTLARITTTAALTALLLTAASCTRLTETPESPVTDDAARKIDQARTERPSNLVTHTDRPFLGERRPFRIGALPANAPAELQTTMQITVLGDIRLRDLARMIESHSGLPVTVDSAVPEITATNTEAYGTVAEVLDRITADHALFWRIERDAVHIAMTDLRSWLIFAAPTTSTWTATYGAPAASGLSAQDQVTLTTTATAIWNHIDTTVKAMLSPAGRHTIDLKSGELVVIDIPAALDRIDRWVAEKNRWLTAQVAIKLDIYEIERSRLGSTGVSLEGVLHQVFGDQVYTFEAGSDDDESFFGLRYRNGQSPASALDDFAVVLRDTYGSDSISQLTSTVVRAVNGVAVPVFFGDERSYLERRDVVSDESGRSVRLIPGKLKDGIAINIMPSILPDTDRLMLTVSIRTTRIKSIQRFPADATANDPVLQLPDVESRSVMNQVFLQHGETLVVAGLDTTRGTAEDSTGLLSFSSRTASKTASLVILITPEIALQPTAVTSAARGGQWPR